MVIEGVPAHGIIDSGADITIMEGNLFTRIAAVTKLKKKHFKAVDKVQRTYDQHPFSLDGKVHLDITFIVCQI